MSGHWCHCCMLSPSELENCDNEKGDKWSIQLIKDNLKKQFSNLDMTPYDKKGCVLPMLFDTIPIENYIFSLLHAEIGIGNKIISSFYTWLTTNIEPLLGEEIEMTNTLIDMQLELIDNEKKVKEVNQHNITILADLTNDKKSIESVLIMKKVMSGQFNLLKII